MQAEIRKDTFVVRAFTAHRAGGFAVQVIKDWKTHESLQYAFVEFETSEAAEEAFFKMDNCLVDDRRIKVNFSQSVAKASYRVPPRYGNAMTDNGALRCVASGVLGCAAPPCGALRCADFFFCGVVLCCVAHCAVVRCGACCPPCDSPSADHLRVWCVVCGVHVRGARSSCRPPQRVLRGVMYCAHGSIELVISNPSPARAVQLLATLVPAVALKPQGRGQGGYELVGDDDDDAGAIRAAAGTCAMPLGAWCLV